MFVEVLKTVAYLHDIELLHRDIKPSNMRILADGRKAVLVDLGSSCKSNTEVKWTKQWI